MRAGVLGHYYRWAARCGAALRMHAQLMPQFPELLVCAVAHYSHTDAAAGTAAHPTSLRLLLPAGGILLLTLSQHHLQVSLKVQAGAGLQRTAASTPAASGST